MFLIRRLLAALLLFAMLYLLAGFLSGSFGGPSKEEEEAYVRDFIEFVEARAQRIDTADGRRGIPAVRVTVKNNGDKTVTNLMLNVRFLDRNGDPLHEDSLLLVSEDGYRLNIPLTALEIGPGKVFKWKEDMWKIFADVPDKWISGDVEVTVDHIDYK